MPLIKNGRVTGDPWRTLADDDALPADGPILVSLARWAAERANLVVRNAPVGIRLASDEPAEAIADDIARFELIALEFPKFTDGRAYSTARILRERYGFGGELRAVGNVLRDQLQFMARCGFDAFELASDHAIEDWQAAIDEIGIQFQPAADVVAPPGALRRGYPSAH